MLGSDRGARNVDEFVGRRKKKKLEAQVLIVAQEKEIANLTAKLKRFEKQKKKHRLKCRHKLHRRKH